MTFDCDGCDGTGAGECANCGDGYQECCCDDPDPIDCSECGGLGVITDGDDELDLKEDYDDC